MKEKEKIEEKGKEKRKKNNKKVVGSVRSEKETGQTHRPSTAVYKRAKASWQ